MINVVPLTIESLVAILLLLTILYCTRLNEQLKRLKADGTSMQQTIAELIPATDTAERAIAGLKETVRETAARASKCATSAASGSRLWNTILKRGNVGEAPPPEMVQPLNLRFSLNLKK